MKLKAVIPNQAHPAAEIATAFAEINIAKSSSVYYSPHEMVREV
jgi:hypothetical protein